MKQYCRYCAFAFEGDAYYCGNHEAVLTESKLKHANTCKDFAYTEEDIITGKCHKIRERKEYYRRTNDGEQMKFGGTEE